MSSPHEFTSAIGPMIARFIEHKQALGLRYESQSYLLAQFDRFLATISALDLTPETFAAWCVSINHLTVNGRRMRLQLVHRFCIYRRRSESTCYVPDPSNFPRQQLSPRPHIFTEGEVMQMLCAADALPAYEFSPLYPQVARLAVVLLYTTGLRRGELVRLTLSDYDPAEHVLFIRDSKFHKSRLVPLSCDGAQELERYLEDRRKPGFPCSADSPLLLHRQRNFSAYSGNGLRVLMRHIFRVAGIRTATGRLPRPHDLRFTFATHALSRWYQTGADVQARLPTLANYMGHASVLSTQYYLPFLQFVAESASEKFEGHCSRFLATTPDQGGSP